ncbi:hypothetical protein BsWGS_04533 [Bradybaena similaris]
MDAAYMGNVVREEFKWTGRGDFLGACLCNICGMAHLWKFPHLVSENGGGAFLIPYFACMISLGVPAMLLELTLGQFSSSGPLNCWGFCPLFSGCGVSMATVSFLTSIYYAVLVSWAWRFFVESLSLEEPWRKCGSWSTPTCSDSAVFLKKSQCIAMNLTANSNGQCTDPENERNGTYIWNYELSKKSGLTITFPANEYFDGAILGYNNHSIENLGHIRGSIVVALLVTWILVWMFMIRGIHLSAKVLIRTMLLPIFILITLAVRGLILDGSREGVLMYLVPEPGKIYSKRVWDEAAQQVFFTLTASYGGLIALARYNEFHYNIFRDIIVISVVDIIVSLSLGVMMFSYIGFVAKKKHISISDVMPSGLGLAFKIMPMALSEVPGTTFWCAVFFLMLVFLSMGSQIIYIETVVSSLMDWKPEFRRRKCWTITAVCVLMFLLGIPMATEGGKDIVGLLDQYCTGTNLYIITLCECIAVAWIYGSKRFLDDVDIMLGRRLCSNQTIDKLLHLWFRGHWTIVTPVFVLVIIFTSSSAKRLPADIMEHPPWVEKVGWVITGTCTISILIVAVYRLLIAEGSIIQALEIENYNITFCGLGTTSTDGQVPGENMGADGLECAILPTYDCRHGVRSHVFNPGRPARHRCGPPE